MFRKFFAAIVAVVLTVGGVFAEDIKGVFKKFDKESGKVTISVDDKETVYAVSKDAKTKVKKKEVLLTDALGDWKADQKATFTVEDKVVTMAKKEKK